MTTQDKKQLKLMRLTREQYLKTMLLDLEMDPKKFMFEVTCNTPEHTKIYHLINACYKDRIALKKAKQLIFKSSVAAVIANMNTPLPNMINTHS